MNFSIEFLYLHSALRPSPLAPPATPATSDAAERAAETTFTTVVDVKAAGAENTMAAERERRSEAVRFPLSLRIEALNVDIDPTH